MIKLVALDLDGTLTQHRSKIDEKCLSVLKELDEKYKLVMVCAGGCERVYNQLDCFPIDILGFYGMETSKVENDRFIIENSTVVEADKFKISDNINQLRKELGFVDYYGESVEFHKLGLITFPIIGTNAPLDEKLAFDPDRSKRREHYNYVSSVFTEYNVFVGGSSSFDIVPKPFCKLNALEKYLDKHNIDRNEVIYFGDDYGFGGNDSDVYNSDIKFVKMEDYRDFPTIAKEILL